MSTATATETNREQRRQGLATVQEAAEFLNMCRTSIYAMMRDKELPSVSVRNAKRIPWQALFKITDAAMAAANSDEAGV